MPSKSVAALLGIAATMACAHEATNPPQTSPPTVSSAAATANDTSAAKGPNVVIGGVVSTDPFHAIKAGAVVYLEDGPKEHGVGMAASLDNHDMTFVPFITVITAGGTLTFGNTDPFTHNAFSPDGEGWDIGEIPAHGALAKTFNKPNVYSVLCNIHKNMLAYIVVSPSSYFARTDADGRYSLSVPPGTYKVTAWSPRLKPLTQPVTATSGSMTLNFALAR